MRKLCLAIVALTVIAGYSGPSLAEKVRVGLPVPLTGFVAESAKARPRIAGRHTIMRRIKPRTL